MNKAVVAALCAACLFLQGCWTTSMVKNPRYIDCASHHDRGRTASTGGHYVTVVSANNGSCFGAEGGRLSQAKEQAMENCKSNGSKDCTVFAENGKIVLAATVKDRDVDWDGTFTLLTLGMAGAVAYEAGKSGTPVEVPAYTPSAYTPSRASTSVVERAPSPAAASGPTGSQSQASTGGRRYVAGANASSCVSVDRKSSSFNFLVNNCPYKIAVYYCVNDHGHSFQCGRGGKSGVGQLTHIGPNSKSTTLKGGGFHWFACKGENPTDPYSVYLMYADAVWTGSTISAAGCYTYSRKG